MTMIRRRGDHRSMPWRNGGGVTLEVTRQPEGATLDGFEWRMSFAHLESGGPFSAYPGVDRVIMLVRGGRMRLTLTGARGGPEVHDLGRFEPFAFRGEAEVACEISERSMDFNVMVRRDWGTADVRIHRVTSAGTLIDPVRAGRRLVVVLDGEVELEGHGTDGVHLEALEVASDFDAPLSVRALGQASVLAVVTIRPKKPDAGEG